MALPGKAGQQAVQTLHSPRASHTLNRTYQISQAANMKLATNQENKKVQPVQRKSGSVSRSDSSPLSVLDFLSSPTCSTPSSSPVVRAPVGSLSPVVPQSPLHASQKLFARLSSKNFKTPGREASSHIPPRALQGARPPSPRRQQGARARFKRCSFGRSSSLNENKVNVNEAAACLQLHALRLPTP